MTTNYLDEQKLIKDILKGKKSALYFFWLKHKGKIFSYLRQKITNEKDAEEILQDVFLASLDSLRDFRSNCSLSTYLYSIARYKVIDYYRKKKITQIVFSRAPALKNLISEVIEPEEELIKKEAIKKIKTVLKKLAPEEIKIIYLKYEKGLTVKAIAQKLCLTIKSVESRLFRARRAFIKIFNEDEQNFKKSLKKTKRNLLPAISQ